MKRKLQINDRRRSRHLSKIQVCKIGNLRGFYRYHRKLKKYPKATKQKIAVIHEMTLKRVGTQFQPMFQGHYQQAWNSNK